MRAALLSWYPHAARDLPWRRSQDAYPIWVSEIMLQQTRVETVVDYFHGFLEEFPTVVALGQAKEESVLARWSGLGYYRRARSLHLAAQRIATEHGGHFPRTLEGALSLPGVGRYTAAAVLSMAYGLPHGLVDGNVERVFSRFFGMDGVAGSSDLARACWTLADQLVPKVQAGDWNQALMELGATICTPKQTRCENCPLRRSCQARKQGIVAELPRPKLRPAVKAVAVEVLVVRRGREALMERRPPGKMMAGLWQFPTRMVGPGPEEASGLFPRDWPAGLCALAEPDLGVLQHSITCFSIGARVRRGSLGGKPRGQLGDRFKWVSPEQLPTLALTGMAKKCLVSL